MKKTICSFLCFAVLMFPCTVFSVDTSIETGAPAQSRGVFSYTENETSDLNASSRIQTQSILPAPIENKPTGELKPDLPALIIVGLIGTAALFGIGYLLISNL